MITEAIKKLEARGQECIDNSKPHKMPAAFGPGDIYWQGDVGLLMLKSVPRSAKRNKEPWRGDLQLTEGTSRGSRHCIPQRYEKNVRVYDDDTEDILNGQVLKADAPFDLIHPEHADHIGYPAGVYRVRYQQNSLRHRVLD